MKQNDEDFGSMHRLVEGTRFARRSDEEGSGSFGTVGEVFHTSGHLLSLSGQQKKGAWLMQRFPRIGMAPMARKGQKLGVYRERS
jgi:hypothetical protein